MSFLLTRLEITASSLSIASTSTRFLSQSLNRKWQVYENERYFEPGEEPWKRIKHVITYDFKRSARRYREAKYDAFRRKHPLAYMNREIQDYELLPMRCEFLVIGGGLTGSSLAYWIKQRFRDENVTVSVVENTENFSKTRSLLGTGVVSQQFSVPEMVDLALFSAEFLRHAGEHLRILDNEPPDVHLLPVGVMHLARTQEEAEAFKNAWRIQIERGAHVLLLSQEELKTRFPFMNFDDIISGTYGLENEGIFDTCQFLSALREKNITLGVRYLKADFEGAITYGSRKDQGAQKHGTMPTNEADLAVIAQNQICGGIFRPQMSGASARPIKCYQMYNAAGPWAGEVARRAGIGYKSDLMAIPVPIVCTRRTNFIIHAPEVPTLQMPILMDSSGIFCRPDNIGHNYVCGRNPTKKDAIKMMKEKPEDDPPIDYNEFYENIWPALIRRVPSFQNAKVINAWHSYEDMNIFDDAPIVGEHLVHENFFQVCGLGGYGPQLSIAIGKCLAERIYDLAYTSVNLRKFDMRRVMHGRRIHELFRCT